MTQSIEYHHKGSPATKKFETTPTAGKDRLTAFLDVNDVVHSEFMSTGTIINSKHCAGMPQELEVHI
jgi:hypothetical protein